MAVYKIFPEKDAALYSLFPQMNTGLDEILDVSNLNFAIENNAQVGRSLIKFNQSGINSLFADKIQTKEWDATLKCYIATAQSINLEYNIDVFPVSGAWGMGTGKYLDQPMATDGVSWRWQNYKNGIGWQHLGFSPFVTASYSGSNIGGGVWYYGSTHTLPVTASQEFTYHSDKDLSVGVKGIVSAWVSSSLGINAGNTDIPNEGFILKWEPLIEFNPVKAVQPVLQYYSVDTHTIYPPVLEMKWKDYVWDTGSNVSQSILDTPQAYYSIATNNGFFYPQSVQQFRVDCRPQFPPIVFQTSSIYTTNYYLPTSSYWAIKDLDTNEYIVDFDSTYTQISADATSSYFDVYMNGLQPERYYTILLKTTIQGTTTVVDSNFNFKVING
jgi:hypothetical protein